MDTCAICGCGVAFVWPCAKIHQEHCHDCWRLSLAAGSFENVPHPAPQETPPLTLTPRELAAVALYARHLVRVTGTGTLADLVTEEGEA